MLKELKKGKNKKEKVFVGMSGGVDSSVAAFLLKKRGYEVIGIFMKCFNLDGCAERDAEDARRVAEKLEIPFYVWDFEEEYKKKVVEYMVEGYRQGITPNPDVMCNREIKFGIFLEKALKMGADYVATGHYVKLKTENLKTKKLYIANDKNKDQSYFLWTLIQKQLKHCLFPIGDYLKSEVREIAKKAGLPTAEKKDSQGICFLGKVTLNEFLSQYITPKKGAVLNEKGEKIGEHKGAYFYTIGQRHIGTNLRPIINNQQPFYVAEKNVKTNTLILAEGSDNNILFKKEIKISSLNWILGKFPHSAQKVFARVRYRQPLAEAELFSDKGGYKLIFSEPVKFVANGQSTVFYGKDGEMLGGGIIV
ncbi:MAG: tRNA-specific 2-thiouridylase mnmA [Candidatus Wolfebacteria bacterium GW2011_GWC1_37_10]|uniref:tRNA-specific 2-thiouridylase MnmA n=1 Tax=Candidatus Wolfebacteria bacterium GW2011_GWC1_37_10 TaxID=1619010 RepID=A0A0G0FZE0_9BACT|nr:MAG: tRNA-specific 2-thiouridylase mnmA [Candidatus Wolfebacteria bacterium GW2011_GWC1_37_10]